MNTLIGYLNINGDSNVELYEVGATFIRVKFKGVEKIYQYSYSKAGKNSVERMKILANRGYGLNEYINRNVKFLFD